MNTLEQIDLSTWIPLFLAKRSNSQLKAMQTSIGLELKYRNWKLSSKDKNVWTG